MARLGRAQPFAPKILRRRFALASAALTGTITASATQADIRAGGKTIILTLTGDTWVSASFDAQRQNIIDGMTSAQNELLGWNNVVKALQGVAGVVRTSDSVVTITLDAQVTYTITATETITVTIPASALVLGLAVVAAPTFTVQTAVSDVFIDMLHRIEMGIVAQTAAGMGGVLVE